MNTICYCFTEYELVVPICYACSDTLAIKMATGSPYFEDVRGKSEVIDLPSCEDMMDIGEHENETAQSAVKPNLAVSSSVHELLECPVCLTAMYPPIHQVQ